MNSKERVQSTLNHKQPDRMAVDFGSAAVSGIHCLVVKKLKEYYGIETGPVKIIEPMQMLAEVDTSLQDIMGIDCVPVFGRTDMFGATATAFHEQKTPWGQNVLISKDINLATDSKGDAYFFPKGDKTTPPSGIMPEGCYFANAIERTESFDDSNLCYEDNLEEYGLITDEDLTFFTERINEAAKTNKAVVASLGGAALGDVAFIPGISLKSPKGVRSVTEWYMSILMRPDYIHRVFERQVDIAIENYSKIWDKVGDKVDVVFTCGTDFGTQDSQFCSPETFNELWLPHYKRMNDWIHINTTWKVLKHSCGAIMPLLPSLIEAGFDIINPVQINASGMDSQILKNKFGDKVTFWGGGIDTQKVLPFGTPEEVREHVLRQCEILSKNGGYVFNSVHNIQANAPIENIVAMIAATKEFRGM